MKILFKKTTHETALSLILFGLVLAMKPVLFSSLHTNGIWEWWLFHVAVLMVLPVVLIRLVLEKKMDQYNWRFLLDRKDMTIIVAGLTSLVLMASLIMVLFKWKTILSVSVWTQGGLGMTLFVDLLLLPAVVLSQEFFFRGYLLNSWLRASGPAVAIGATAICGWLFVFMFSGTVGWQRGIWLFLIELILGIIAFKGKTFVDSAIVHWTFLVGIDLLVIAHAAGFVRFF